MSIYKIQYDPDNNIINIDDYNDPHSKAIIFFYEILRCEGYAEVRICCDDCNVRQCIYTCAADKTDAVIVAEVNIILDDAIDNYACDYLVDPDWDTGLGAGRDRNGHYQRCSWCD